MTGRRVALALSLFLLVPLGAASAPSRHITVESVAFRVSNPLDPGKTYTVRGELIRPRGCTRSVLLAEHGLSYGMWSWDFPIQPAKYSVARALAARGFGVLAIDRLGYGSSAGKGAPDHPNGYTLTVQSYADITAQIIRQLRAGTYIAKAPARFARVGLLGHSAGAEIVELTAGLYPDLVDLLIATAYTHEPFVNNLWLVREWSQDNIRAAQSDYEYFETNPSIRAGDMYNLALADPAIVRADTARANLTPSGEVFSIGNQPSRWVIGSIRVPMLLVLGERDTLFPGSEGANDLVLFTAASDKTLKVIPGAGHTFMLHRNAPSSITYIGDWLLRHASVVPRC